MEHPGFTLWLTGPPGAGKTTLAGLVAVALRARGMKVETLDDDTLRPHLSAGAGFTYDDCNAYIRRIAFICQLLARNGVAAIAATTSPDRATRAAVRQMVGQRLVAVHCHAAPAVLARRCAPGQRPSETPHAHDASESDESPDVRIDSGIERPEQSAAKILKALQALGYVPRAARSPSAGGDTGDDEAAIAAQMRALGYI